MHRYSQLLRVLLEKKGIKNEEEAEAFLNPKYKEHFHDPFLMRDMDKACTRIFDAITNNEKIIVYADYDCDGIPGAVILKDLFNKVGFENFEVYIPERNSEGYGLNLDAIKEFKKKDVKLVITVDLGTTAIEEIEEANKLGIDVIITDHHLAPDKLPKAYAILNPKTDEYPEKMLCGAGVVFKLVQGFIKKYGEQLEIQDGWEKWLLDMAGLATLSDRVPLLGENRAISYFGMIVLRKSPRVGLQRLLAAMNINQRHLTEDDVGFMLTPRLNAASRMDSPMRAFEILSTNDEVQASALALHLSKINDHRKNLVTSIMRDINKNLEQRGESEVIVIGNPKWLVGVLGLIAGKVMDKYEKPVFVWGKDDNGVIKGSCRSPGSVSVVDLMQEARDSFLDFGGHELAGGFSVDGEKIHFLEQTLSEAFNKVKRLEESTGEAFDVKADLGIVSMENWQELSKLAPFGHSNEKPIFLFEKVRVEKTKKFGKNGGEHLEITFSNDGKNKATAVSFFTSLDSFTQEPKEGFHADLLATLDLSRFRGKEELRLRIVDILFNKS